LSLVIDASVAVKWVLSEPESELAEALFDEGKLIAPGLWLTESANVLWKYYRRGRLSADEVFERVRALRVLPVETVDDHFLLEIAAGLAVSLDHSIYDCLYLAAATTQNAILVSADLAFVAIVRKSPFASFIRPLAGLP